MLLINLQVLLVPMFFTKWYFASQCHETSWRFESSWFQVSLSRVCFKRPIWMLFQCFFVLNGYSESFNFNILQKMDGWMVYWDKGYTAYDICMLSILSSSQFLYDRFSIYQVFFKTIVFFKRVCSNTFFGYERRQIILIILLYNVYVQLGSFPVPSFFLAVDFCSFRLYISRLQLLHSTNKNWLNMSFSSDSNIRKYYQIHVYDLVIFMDHWA